MTDLQLNYYTKGIHKRKVSHLQAFHKRRPTVRNQSTASPGPCIAEKL